MAMLVWNGSAWKPINADNDLINGSFGGLAAWNGSGWFFADNAKIWNGSAWKGFLDNVMLDDAQIWTQSSFGGGEIAVYNVSSNGFAYGNYQLINQWIKNPDNSSQYQIFATQSAGPETIQGAPLNTWLDLGPAANWEWYIAPFDNTGMAFMEVEIRHKITQQSLTQASISLTVSQEQIPN